MDYEKAYKDALDRARNVYTYYCDDNEQLRKIESIFPELKESKDERIRKEILNFLKTNNAWNKEWLTWLERQVEKPQSKPALDAINEEIVDNANKADSIKLAESEDERIRNGLIALLKFGLEDGSAIAPGFNETKEQALVWLEKQAPKQKWSEEDEKMLNHIIGLLEGLPNLHNWLKSLKQRYTWKPSEEQMKALKETCDEHWEPDGLDPLYTLWKQLKKLKGE